MSECKELKAMQQALDDMTAAANEARAALQTARADKQNAVEAWEVAQGTIERQRAKIGDLCNETQEHRAKIAWLNELVATLRAGSSHEAAQEAQDKIEKQRAELDRLNKLVTQLRSANVKLAESACIFPDDFDGNPIDLPAEARFAMGALHRVRLAICERRKVYAFRATDDYNNAYNDGGNNALNAIEVAIGGER